MPAARTPAKATRKPAAEMAACREVIEAALRMSRLGLSPGRSGNVSRRWRDGMLITPTGMPYDAIEPDDVVFVGASGDVRGKRKPSSEWRFHLSAYDARPEMLACVHTHSTHAVVLACARRPIPAFHYMIAVAGGSEIPCVPYATFGTPELARHVASGLLRHDACLMANHGQIALGTSLERALELAAEVEVLAEQYCKLLMLGKPHLLNDAEMAEVLERFKSYGQNAQS
ncbi:MAG: class II aldolase/adducin family protein [Hyphomicrobiaceae bacterium]